jgi:hypothetical protein
VCVELLDVFFFVVEVGLVVFLTAGLVDFLADVVFFATGFDAAVGVAAAADELLPVVDRASRCTPESVVSLLERTSLIALVCSPRVIRNS